MNYSKCAEDCYRIYSKGDPSFSSGLELADFEDAVQSAYAYKVKYDYLTNKEVSQAFLQEFLNVPVILNESTQTYYSPLPAQVLDLPKNAGIVITQMKNSQNQFAPESLGQSYIFSSNPTDKITYHRDKENIYYGNFDPSIKLVYMQFPPLFSENIPDEFVAEIQDLVLNKFFKVEQLQQDKIDDNNPNQRQQKG